MTRSTLLGTLALLTMVPAAAAAQAAPRAQALEARERAEILSEQGWLLASQRGDFAEAATWLRAAAILREDSPQKVRDLMNAGRFHFYAGHHMGAASALREAGEVATALGDAQAARQAYRDGAWAAAQAGDLLTARTLLKKAGIDAAGA